MPDGANIVNTARGALIAERALADALTSGKLASAGLDVYQTKPGGSRDISALPNTFLLPHIGSANMETRDTMGFRALDNLMLILQAGIQKIVSPDKNNYKKLSFKYVCH